MSLAVSQVGIFRFGVMFAIVLVECMLTLLVKSTMVTFTPTILATITTPRTTTAIISD